MQIEEKILKNAVKSRFLARLVLSLRKEILEKMLLNGLHSRSYLQQKRPWPSKNDDTRSLVAIFVFGEIYQAKRGPERIKNFALTRINQICRNSEVVEILSKLIQN